MGFTWFTHCPLSSLTRPQTSSQNIRSEIWHQVWVSSPTRKQWCQCIPKWRSVSLNGDTKASCNCASRWWAWSCTGQCSPIGGTFFRWHKESRPRCRDWWYQVWHPQCHFLCGVKRWARRYECIIILWQFRWLTRWGVDWRRRSIGNELVRGGRGWRRYLLFYYFYLRFDIKIPSRFVRFYI